MHPDELNDRLPDKPGDSTRDARLAALRRMLADGEASGDAGPFDFSKFLTRQRRNGDHKP